MNKEGYLPETQCIEFTERAEIIWNKWHNLEQSFKIAVTSACKIKNLIQNPVYFSSKKDTTKYIQDGIKMINDLQVDLQIKITKMKELTKETIQLATILLPEE